MKLIIAPTDFSPVSLNAVSFAADMAITINAGVLLFHAYSIPVGISEVPVQLISTEELKAESEKRLEKLKEKLEHTMPRGVKITTEARLGNTVDELENICDEVKPFAVVMGTKGKNKYENIVFGSTSLTAIRHLTWPVICVPPGKEYGKGIKKIGFACDFREIEKTTPVQFIRNIVWEFDAELHILNVDFKDKYFQPETPEQLFLLHEVLNDLKPQFHFIYNSDVAEGINEFAETNNLDLVLTIPKKHKLLDGIFNPSKSRKLIFQSHIPVMCIHEELSKH